MKASKRKGNSDGKSEKNAKVAVPDGIEYFRSASRAMKRLREICPMPQGRRQEPLPPREDAILLSFWGTFSRWLKNTRTKGIKGVQTPYELWDTIPNQRDFYAFLVLAAIASPEDERGHRFLIECYKVSPDLTCMALPLLRRAVADSFSQLQNPRRSGIQTLNAEAGLRRRIRKAREEILRLSAG